MNQKEKDKVASAMTNRMESHGQTIGEMTDKLMFWQDSHEKKMNETERKPGNKSKYKSKSFSNQDVSTEAYRDFFDTSKSDRNNNTSMKGAVKATVNQIKTPKDRVNGADSWRGNGVRHRFFKSSAAK